MYFSYLISVNDHLKVFGLVDREIRRGSEGSINLLSV